MVVRGLRMMLVRAIEEKFMEPFLLQTVRSLGTGLAMATVLSLPDGTIQSVTQDADPAVRVGQKVRIVNGLVSRS